MDRPHLRRRSPPQSTALPPSWGRKPSWQFTMSSAESLKWQAYESRGTCRRWALRLYQSIAIHSWQLVWLMPCSGLGGSLCIGGSLEVVWARPGPWLASWLKFLALSASHPHLLAQKSSDNLCLLPHFPTICSQQSAYQQLQALHWRPYLTECGVDFSE